MVFVSLFPYVVSVSLGFPYMESISLGFPHVVMLPRHLNVFTPLFWIQHCYELLWTLHCPKGRYCDVTMIRPLLFHGMRTDLRGSPGAAIVDCQWIYFLLDFKRICFIFPWNNSTYDLDATVGWLESLGYSINARTFGPLTPYLAVGLAGVTMCTRVNNYLWNHIFCHFKASLFLFQLMFVLDKRNTFVFTRQGQADIPREVSGRGRPVVGPAVTDFPLDVCRTVSRNHKVFLL